MRSIALHLELYLPSESAPVDLFSIRNGDKLFYDASRKQVANCVQFLDLLADCVERYAGRFRISVTIHGTTARLLHEAGIGPRLAWLADSGCVQFCLGTRDRVMLDRLSPSIIAAQLACGKSDLLQLIGSYGSLTCFGDPWATIPRAGLEHLHSAGITASLFAPERRLGAIVIDQHTGIRGVPIFVRESANLDNLLAGNGIPGQVTQELRNVAQTAIPIISICPQNHRSATEMFPRWLHALFSDPQMRTLTIAESTMRIPSQTGDLITQIKQPTDTSLGAAIRRQILDLQPLLPADESESGWTDSVHNWHSLLARANFMPPEHGAQSPHRRISGDPAIDHFIKISTAIASVELQLRACKLSHS